MGNNKENYKVAYFSMEIAIKNSIKSFSGGLGVLAGDTLKSAADLEIPIIGITLLNDHGYFRQKINEEGYQEELPDNYDKHQLKEVGKTCCNIASDRVNIKVWMYEIEGQSGHRVPVLFLDSDLESNKEVYRNLTKNLYGGDNEYRLKQEIILGRGGVNALEVLGYYDELEKYHLNEGHAALATIELLSRMKPRSFALSTKSAKERIEEIRKKCVFTTHTPVKAGHDIFPLEMVKRYQPDFPYTIPEITVDNKLNMSRLAAYFSSYVNGVSKKHGQVSEEMFPDQKVDYITNGVHPGTWVSDQFKSLFDKELPDWRSCGFSLRNAIKISKRDIWDTHENAKKSLFDYVSQETGVEMNKEIFTIGFARRFATYKRPTLLLHDMEKLLDIHKNVGNIQIIYAGKAHPHDGAGKDEIKRVNEIIQNHPDIKMVFLENYDMELAQKLIPGVDLWLNNPVLPKEGCGTSGMKAALNGVPQLSTLDGWWLEGFIEGETGWAIDGDPQNPENNFEEDAYSLYSKLEEIIPIYYDKRKDWIAVMRQTIATNGSHFNSERMVRQYAQKAYM